MSAQECFKTYNYNQVINTRNFEIHIDLDAKYGFFEHKLLGEDCAGGLWFDDCMFLNDYDGVFELPGEVIRELSSRSYIDAEEFQP